MQNTNNYLVQAQIDGRWIDVARRGSMESAEHFAECLEKVNGVPHRACSWLPTLTPNQLSEGDVAEVRR